MCYLLIVTVLNTSGLLLYWCGWDVCVCLRMAQTAGCLASVLKPKPVLPRVSNTAFKRQESQESGCRLSGQRIDLC